MRKRVAGIVVGLTCLTLVATPTAWAAPQQVVEVPGNWWTAWLTEIAPRIDADWKSVKNAFLAITREIGTSGGVPGEVSSQDAGSCSESFTLEQGCTPDPNG